MDTNIRTITTDATLREKKKLRRELRLSDLTFFTAASLIGIDTLGAVSSHGGQAIIWVIISAITFLLPYGLLVAELGSTFTQEGGFYEWCKLAGGRFYAALAAMFYWISNPLWVGGTLSVTAIVAIKTLWFGSPEFVFGGNIILDAVIQMLIALFFIWGTTWFAIISLRIGKWLFIGGLFVKLGLYGLFVTLAIIYAFSGKATGQYLTFSDVLPSNDWMLIAIGILPLMVFNWCGFELQNSAGEEMRNPRKDVPIALAKSAIVTVIAFTGIVATILLTMPKDQMSSASGFVSAYQIVVDALPGPVALFLSILVGLGVVIANACSGGTWLIGSDRTYAIAALDRAAPMLLGRFSGKYGTPIAVNTMSGIISTITVGAAIVFTAANGGTTPTLFSLVLGFVLSTTVIAYTLIFPAFLLLRYKYPKVHRPYKVPGGMIGAWIVTLFPLLYAALATVFVLYPSDISSSGLSRFTYELTQIVPLLIIVLFTIVFYLWGHAEKRNKDIVVDLDLVEQTTIEQGAIEIESKAKEKVTT